jgi:hypothetical protein
VQRRATRLQPAGHPPACTIRYVDQGPTVIVRAIAHLRSAVIPIYRARFLEEPICHNARGSPVGDPRSRWPYGPMPCHALRWLCSGAVVTPRAEGEARLGRWRRDPGRWTLAPRGTGHFGARRCCSGPWCGKPARSPNSIPCHRSVPSTSKIWVRIVDAECSHAPMTAGS